MNILQMRVLVEINVQFLGILRFKVPAIFLTISEASNTLCNNSLKKAEKQKPYWSLHESITVKVSNIGTTPIQAPSTRYTNFPFQLQAPLDPIFRQHLNYWSKFTHPITHVLSVSKMAALTAVLQQVSTEEYITTFFLSSECRKVKAACCSVSEISRSLSH